MTMSTVTYKKKEKLRILSVYYTAFLEGTYTLRPM
jgi:hypothetical protein